MTISYFFKLVQLIAIKIRQKDFFENSCCYFMGKAAHDLILGMSFIKNYNGTDHQLREITLFTVTGGITNQTILSLSPWSVETHSVKKLCATMIGVVHGTQADADAGPVARRRMTACRNPSKRSFVTFVADVLPRHLSHQREVRVEHAIDLEPGKSRASLRDYHMSCSAKNSIAASGKKVYPELNVYILFANVGCQF